MTLEKAIEFGKIFLKTIEDEKGSATYEFVEMAIKALEQEPSEDCISREDFEKRIKPYDTEDDMDKALYNFAHNTLICCPSVKPKEKVGRWIGFTHSAYHGIDDDGEPIWREVKVYHCNLCNRRTVIKENFCPNCGSRMEGSE